MDFKRLGTDLLALVLFAGILFLGLSLFSYDPAEPPASTVHPPRDAALNLGGPLGARIAHGLLTAFGLGAYVVLIGLAVLDAHLFSRSSYRDPYFRLFGFGLLLTGFCTAVQWILPGLSAGSIAGSGGYVGA